jgi:hypothetical protein
VIWGVQYKREILRSAFESTSSTFAFLAQLLNHCFSLAQFPLPPKRDSQDLFYAKFKPPGLKPYLIGKIGLRTFSIKERSHAGNPNQTYPHFGSVAKSLLSWFNSPQKTPPKIVPLYTTPQLKLDLCVVEQHPVGGHQLVFVHGRMH